MRTTINIDDQLFYEAKKLAVESHKTLASVIEDALRNTFTLKNVEEKNTISLVTMKGDGLKHGVDLNNNGSLSDLMDD